MSEMSYGRALGWLAEQQPDAPALIHEGTRRTRRELEQRSNRLARAYADLGVEAGDLVTLALPNSIEFFEACLAIWKLGATPQPISSRLPEVERRAIVDLAGPRERPVGRRANRSGARGAARGHRTASSSWARGATSPRRSSRMSST